MYVDITLPYSSSIRCVQDRELADRMHRLDGKHSHGINEGCSFQTFLTNKVPSASYDRTPNQINII